MTSNAEHLSSIACASQYNDCLGTRSKRPVEFQLSLTQNKGSSFKGLTPFRQKKTKTKTKTKNKYKAAKRIKKMIKCQSAEFKFYRQIHICPPLSTVYVS